MTADAARFRVGLVGAGYISEFHVAALRRVRYVEIVGVTDIDANRAQALAARFGLRVFPSLASLCEAGANVVHVLTPPESHAAVASEALRCGCHVLVEKPLATDVGDGERLRDLARNHGRTLGVCHSLLFDPHVVRALQAVKRGDLGRVVAVDILRSSAYPPYAGGPLPLHSQTPGFAFRDLGIHCLYLLDAFLGPIEAIDATWKNLGGDSSLPFDEWRAMVRCRDGIGQFQLSWNVRPLQNQIIIQGTKGVRRVDLFLLFQGTRRSLPIPKAAERVVNAVSDSLLPFGAVAANVVRFALGRVRPYQGVRNFVVEFYRALREGRNSPVTAEDALPIVRWVEEVAQRADRDFESRRSARPAIAPAACLVSGASGGLGTALVERLQSGEMRPVRALMRRPSDDTAEGLQVVVGNLGDPEAVDSAVRGARLVFHLGAATRGSWADYQCATVVGTRNVVEACKRNGVEKLVHVSSLSVLDWAGAAEGTPLTEESPLESRPEERGFYTRAKLEAERIVVAAAQEGLPTVILRPGQIFGERIPIVTPAVARRLGKVWLVLGDGHLHLPLVYIDDVVDALVLAAKSSLQNGEIVHLVDQETVTQDEVLRLLGENATPIVHLPRRAVFLAGVLSEPLFALLGRPSPLSYYRLRSALARRQFYSDRADRLLGWRPQVGTRQGIARLRRPKPPLP